LNKAHVKYLESRLIEEAQAIGRVPLDNGNNPARPGLSEAAQANMEGFLEYLFIVLPAIGIDMFVRRTRRTSDDNRTHPKTDAPGASSSVVFETQVKKYKIKATAKLESGEFIVQAGSLARKAWMGQGAHNYKKLFDELVRTGVLVARGEHRVFAENYAFTSPSAAGAMVTGRSCNGQLAWTVKGTSETYREWEQRKLAEKE
jgi:hypothetical protein